MLILAWKSDAQHPLESAYLLQELDMKKDIRNQFLQQAFF